MREKTIRNILTGVCLALVCLILFLLAMLPVHHSAASSQSQTLLEASDFTTPVTNDQQAAIEQYLAYEQQLYTDPSASSPCLTSQEQQHLRALTSNIRSSFAQSSLYITYATVDMDPNSLLEDDDNNEIEGVIITDIHVSSHDDAVRASLASDSNLTESLVTDTHYYTLQQRTDAPDSCPTYEVVTDTVPTTE